MGVERPARAMRAHDCRFKCFEKISQAERNYLFQEFYKKNHTSQTEFLASCRSVTSKKQATPAAKDKDKRKISIHWSLPIRGQRQREKVCGKAIQDLFDISRGRLRGIDKILQGGDKRGKYTKGKKKDRVKEFFNKIPTHKSHYNKKGCPHRFYVAIEDIKCSADLYALYKTACVAMTTPHHGTTHAENVSKLMKSSKKH